MMLPRDKERKLIRLAKEGDACAVEQLIRAHQDAVYAFILRLSGKSHLTEDIVQEAFVRVLKNLDRFDDRYRFSTWLFTIAKRLYLNAMQKMRPAYDTSTVSLQEGASEAPSGRSVRTETIENMRELLDVALDELSTRQREIVLLYHQQNWSITDIAAHLRMPEGTIKSHLHRARQRMKRAITSDARTHAHAEEVFS